jgi:hypothetical protein
MGWGRAIQLGPLERAISINGKRKEINFKGF